MKSVMEFMKEIFINCERDFESLGTVQCAVAACYLKTSPRASFNLGPDFLFKYILAHCV